MQFRLTNQESRHVILYLQGLCEPPDRAWDKRDLTNVIKNLGFVQVDSIQWVERAHHMILSARSEHYRPADLVPLLESSRTLFENWTHDASIIPLQFYPYLQFMFKRREKRLLDKFDKWQGEGYRSNCKKLLKRIRSQGGLMSKDLDRPKVKSGLSMWQWHDGKAALEFLWRTGKLTISERRGFQKVYDLTERTIPKKFRDKKINKSDFIDWSCRTALTKLGFATISDIAHFWNFLTLDEVKNWVSHQSPRIIKEVIVEGYDGSEKTFLCRPDLPSLISKIPSCPTRLRVLSPFDPVIRDRKRLLWLYGFDYRIEIYVPAAKRIWGYYIFPLLRGDRIVGRIDMKANRQASSLDVRKVWWEQGVRPSSKELEKELKRQMKFTGMTTITRYD